MRRINRKEPGKRLILPYALSVAVFAALFSACVYVSLKPDDAPPGAADIATSAPPPAEPATELAGQHENHSVNSSTSTATTTGRLMSEEPDATENAAPLDQEQLAALIWCEDPTLFKESYRTATEEQKGMLSNLLATDPFVESRGGLPIRGIMTIMGDLPKDAPRLTLDQAKNIADKLAAIYAPDTPIGDDVILDEFDGIAGAPDSKYGSGFTYHIYSLNESCTEFISVCGGGFSHVVLGDSGNLISQTYLYPVIDPGITPAPTSTVGASVSAPDKTPWPTPSVPPTPQPSTQPSTQPSVPPTPQPSAQPAIPTDSKDASSAGHVIAAGPGAAPAPGASSAPGASTDLGVSSAPGASIGLGATVYPGTSSVPGASPAAGPLGQDIPVRYWQELPSLLDESYSAATDAQKDMLDMLMATDPFVESSYGLPIRDIKIIMGELPDDTPRLSLEQAKSVIGELAASSEPGSWVEESLILDAFDGIAGAPDSKYGSGSTSYAYCINDEKKEFISVSGSVRHIILGESAGEWEETPLYPFFDPGNSPAPTLPAQ